MIWVLPQLLQVWVVDVKMLENFIRMFFKLIQVITMPLSTQSKIAADIELERKEAIPLCNLAIRYNPVPVHRLLLFENN